MITPTIEIDVIWDVVRFKPQSYYPILEFFHDLRKERQIVAAHPHRDPNAVFHAGFGIHKEASYLG